MKYVTVVVWHCHKNSTVVFYHFGLIDKLHCTHCYGLWHVFNFFNAIVIANNLLNNECGRQCKNYIFDMP